MHWVSPETPAPQSRPEVETDGTSGRSGEGEDRITHAGRDARKSLSLPIFDGSCSFKGHRILLEQYFEDTEQPRRLEASLFLESLRRGNKQAKEFHQEIVDEGLSRNGYRFLVTKAEEYFSKSMSTFEYVQKLNRMKQLKGEYLDGWFERVYKVQQEAINSKKGESAYTIKSLAMDTFINGLVDSHLRWEIRKEVTDPSEKTLRELLNTTIKVHEALKHHRSLDQTRQEEEIRVSYMGNKNQNGYQNTNKNNYNRQQKRNWQQNNSQGNLNYNNQYPSPNPPRSNPKMSTNTQLSTNPEMSNNPHISTQPQTSTLPHMSPQPHMSNNPQMSTNMQLSNNPQKSTNMHMLNNDRLSTNPQMSTHPLMSSHQGHPLISTSPLISTNPQMATNMQMSNNPQVPGNSNVLNNNLTQNNNFMSSSQQTPNITIDCVPPAIALHLPQIPTNLDFGCYPWIEANQNRAYNQQSRVQPEAPGFVQIFPPPMTKNSNSPDLSNEQYKSGNAWGRK